DEPGRGTPTVSEGPSRARIDNVPGHSGRRRGQGSAKDSPAPGWTTFRGCTRDRPRCSPSHGRAGTTGTDDRPHSSHEQLERIAGGAVAWRLHWVVRGFQLYMGFLQPPARSFMR